MKRLICLAALLAVLGPFVSSCEQELPQQQAPQTPPSPELAFTTIIRVPLYPGSDALGESAILNPSVIEKENVARLKPVVQQIWQDLSAGKHPAYPVDEEMPAGNTPENYLGSIVKKMAGTQGELSLESMSLGVEVHFSGKAHEDGSTLQAEWLRFVWIDPAQVYPDRNIAQVSMDELGSYLVEDGEGTVPLAEYLDARAYDSYPIRVESEQGALRLRTYDEAREVELLIAQGEVDQLKFASY